MKKFLTLAIVLIAGLQNSYVNAGNTIINVTNPGTFKELVIDLPSERIEKLTISGSLNGDDISYLVSGNGKLARVDTLNLSEVMLVGNDQPYKTLQVATSDIGFGTTTEVYYLSEKDSISEEYVYTGFGGSKITRHVFCKDLSGAFAENSSFKHVTVRKTWRYRSLSFFRMCNLYNHNSRRCCPHR